MRERAEGQAPVAGEAATPVAVRDRGELPFTGLGTTYLGVLGAVLLLTGGLLYRAGGRRPQGDES